ncbi:acyl-CoA thioesterase [Zhongshania aquimaris]|uniref:Thioesterase family protein n=1 Tax=Zhongshania aquimaris TaxID=2857107 RepID=A0ABS6VPR3_9GAMM|nr:acyl-CoA thioesterase domain-containing protein [Zhongshania aquimaris]MBW2940314.1 thioesterase family protein [Zhongshania aquimaris]
MSLLEDFCGHLRMERIADKEFIGHSLYSATKNSVFGGQVMGQALSAACQLVEGRQCHSLSAQFLRAGNLQEPIHYAVATLRDGRNFSVRRVSAVQAGRELLTLDASFHIDAQGFDQQPIMPAVAEPESLPSLASYREKFEQLGLNGLYHFLVTNNVFDFRCIDQPSYIELNNRPAVQRMWMRAKHTLPNEQALQRSILAYICDNNFIRTASLPFRELISSQPSQMATLNHSMWMHRPINLNNWHLYDIHSVNSFGERSLVIGHMYAQSGELVATMVQEGLLRLIDDDAGAVFSENA